MEDGDSRRGETPEPESDASTAPGVVRSAHRSPRRRMVLVAAVLVLIAGGAGIAAITFSRSRASSIASGHRPHPSSSTASATVPLPGMMPSSVGTLVKVARRGGGFTLAVRFVNDPTVTIHVTVSRTTPLVAPTCTGGFSVLSPGSRLDIGTATVPNFTAGSGPYRAAYVEVNPLSGYGVVSSVTGNVIHLTTAPGRGPGTGHFPPPSLTVSRCTSFIPFDGTRPVRFTRAGVAQGDLLYYTASAKSSRNGAPNARGVLIEVTGASGSPVGNKITMSGPSLCRASSLQGTIDDNGAGAGTITQRVVLKNTATSSCTVLGYPGVQMLSATGHLLATHDVLPGAPAIGSEPPATPVVLAHGGAASFLITYSDGNQLSPSEAAACPTSAFLAVTPEGVTGTVKIAAAVTALPYIPGDACGSIGVGAVQKT